MVAVILFFNQNNQLNAQNMNVVIPKISNFPIGDKLPEKYSDYFSGKTYLASLTQNKKLNTPISNVTFEPKCRNNWHSHSGGQILVVVGGKGYYQAKGEPACLLITGDIVEIPANVIHWHGASPDCWFSHLAISPNSEDNKVTWLEPVDNEQYKKATVGSKSMEVNLTKAANKNHEELWPDYKSKAKETDPELIEIFDNWAFDEVIGHDKMDIKTRVMIIMASNIGSQALTEYKMFVNAALNVGVTPVEVKEILYQAVPYVGIAKVIDFIYATNEILKERNIALPLEGQSTTTPENRLKKGLAIQKAIFGNRIDTMYKNSPKDLLHIQEYLSTNCFGDYITRNGLGSKTREMITLSFLIALGGTESQMKGHIQGNLNVGNNRQDLIDLMTQLLPYVGYPRTLNAINCLNEVIPEENKSK